MEVFQNVVSPPQIIQVIRPWIKTNGFGDPHFMEPQYV